MCNLIPALHEFRKLADLIVVATDELEEPKYLRFLEPLVELEGAVSFEKAILRIVLKANKGVPEILFAN